LKNATLRLKDLLEGYMFPKIVKNRMTSNKANQMDVIADRSIADDRADVWVKLPKETVHAERIEIQPWFDYITSFTGNIFGVYSSPSSSQKTFRSSPSGDGQCRITKNHVQTGDGVSVQVHPTSCEIIAAEIQQGSEHLQVIHAQYPTANDDTKFVKVTSAKDSIDVRIAGTNVMVNGRAIPSSGKEDLKDSSGRVVGKVTRRDDGQVDIEISSKLHVTLQSDHTLLVKVDKSHFKSASRGVCGNYNDASNDDLRGPQNCTYDPQNQGQMFGASWVKTDEMQCNEPEMKPILDQVSEYQKKCPHTLATPECSLEAYPILQKGKDLCVGAKKEPVCQENCHSETWTPIPGVVMRCYDPGHAPDELLANKDKGFVDTAPTKQEDRQIKIIYKSPADCKPVSLSAKSGNDNSCFERGYPVSQEGPMVCISSEDADLCKPECRVIDTQPRQVDGKCWNYGAAPQQVKDALRKGYASSPASQSPEFDRTMAVHSARLCSRSGQ
jgi:hypothetical protein